MTYKKYIRRQDIDQLSTQERKGLITYLQLRGVVISKYIEETLIRTEKFNYVIITNHMYIVTHTSTIHDPITLEELKLYSAYFNTNV